MIKPSLLRYIFIQAIICTIVASAWAQKEADFRDVMPQAEIFKPVNSGKELLYYKAYSKDNLFLGVVFKVAAQGYSSTIETLAGMLKDGTITAIKVLSQNETPGVGDRIANPDFIKQFTNKKDLSKVEAISGATISSRAVIDSVQKKAQELKALIKQDKDA